MVIVRIIGGLGNQMFQYAYAKALEKKGYQVCIDISEFKRYKLHGGYQLNKFKIDMQKASTLAILFAKIGFRKSIKEKSLLFDKELLNVPKTAYLKGYFQNENYFLNCKNLLLEQFKINKEFSKTTTSYKHKILKENNSCSIHIRRGDFVSNQKANKVHGTCDIDYYKRAINFLESQYKNIYFFVFSDDITWAKSNLKLQNATYVEHQVIPHEDLFLMSICRFNITANSSFSWWGAWLNQHKNKVVIAPKQWFVSKENEIACDNWIKL